MFTRLGHWGHRLAATSPWTNVYGAVRSLLAAGTLGTLALSTSETLFRPALGMPPPPYCQGAARLSMFCLVPPGQLEIAQWLAIAMLALVISGWRPRWTALLHWWVAFSLQASATIPDGGDQVTAVLTLLLLPVALTDGRRWHWSTPTGVDARPATTREEIRRVAAHMALLLIQFQVAVIYFHAAMAKFGVEEWANGTAMYYWLLHPTFGTFWLRPVIHLLVTIPAGVALLTWGVILLELCIALGLLLPRRIKHYLLVAGITFHVGIALVMGLVSFALAMVGALLLLLHPVDEPLAWPRTLTVVRRRLASPRLARAATAP